MPPTPNEPTYDQLRSLLAAADALLCARANEMLTSEEWGDLEAAVAACSEPPVNERTETFSIDAQGALVRSVAPLNGQPYQHRCPFEAYEAVAYAIADAKGGFNLEDLRGAAGIPWSQAAVAFAFLRGRGVVNPAGGRNHAASGRTPFEDAMIEYHALRENAPGT